VRTVDLASILVALAGSALVLASPRINRIFSHSYVPSSLAFFVLTRVVLLVAIIRLAGHATGPDNVRWILYGESTLAGQLPYVHYPNPYGPGLPYLLAAAFFFLSPAVAPVTLFIVFDFLAFVVLHWVSADRLFCRKVATLYLVAPLSWLMVVRFGQDESIGAFFLVLMLILIRKGRNLLLPVAGALGAACTKALFLLPALPVMLNSASPARSVLIMAIVLIISYVPFWAMGGDIFAWAPRVGQFGGPSIWQAATLRPSLNIMGVVATLDYWRLANAVSTVTVAGLVALVIAKARKIGIVNGVLLLYSGLMLTTTEAWPHYALLVLPVLCLRVVSSGRKRELVFLSAYSFLMLVYFHVWTGLSAEIPSIRWLAAHAVVIAIVCWHCYLFVTSIKAPTT
jgi:hypothetical protein